MEKTNPANSILLVDDERDIVNTLTPRLEQSGFHVAPFTDPISALGHFRENYTQFHALVSDVRMPGMSGFELAKNVKQINPRVRTILLTGFEINPLTLDKLRDTSEVDRFLYKPVSSNRIIELLRNL